MAKPSQIILLLEDKRHEQFIFRYLRKLRIGHHAMRIEKSPPGAGSAEQWVRERFAIEVDACRSRQAKTKLIVLMDADTYTVQQRHFQLDQALQTAGSPLTLRDAEDVARLVPKRNIETWILCLNNEGVNEETDYKTTHDNWLNLIFNAVDTLYLWTRPNAVLPPSCIESLRIGVTELRRLGL